MKSICRNAATAVAALSLILAAAPGAAQQAWEDMVPMRDGVELATNIYLPDGEGPWPVILTRTPYAKDRGLRDSADLPERITPEIGGHVRYLPDGYAQVVQDCRG